ncbi:hypothetical protein PAAG_02964 [Paracoccidioides lutzii Pb01]|uniref:Uncharacterized protein n=1 Tax=Paracoccidioides lutzii (strain ATCC MYA-826 / Pb01) TaxID=502779 RepID=C1GWR9_PARBA|nr:hypothetical protein PAAG_02964 [Paracoccidioides lutzii Pb01]EEH40988.2 hypothetical protein PAAG_02964 [Paracoccidioides lutzii Pb01]
MRVQAIERNPAGLTQHFHAIHANGKISTHGIDSGGFGALGLVGNKSPQYVWFEPEKKDWLGYLREVCDRRGENPLNWNFALSTNTGDLLDTYNECIEGKGESWADFPDIKAQSPDRLGAYFAVSVAAAGWRSAALILIDDGHSEYIENPPITYRFELGSFPQASFNERREIDTDKYDFSTWKYDFPEDSFRGTSWFG